MRGWYLRHMAIDFLSDAWASAVTEALGESDLLDAPESYKLRLQVVVTDRIYTKAQDSEQYMDYVEQLPVQTLGQFYVDTCASSPECRVGKITEPDVTITTNHERISAFLRGESPQNRLRLGLGGLHASDVDNLVTLMMKAPFLKALVHAASQLEVEY